MQLFLCFRDSYYFYTANKEVVWLRNRNICELFRLSFADKKWERNQTMTFKIKTDTSLGNFLMSLVLPLLMVFYLLYLGAANGQFSLTGIDGEYVYLLNGLNISTLQFDNIGFTDHPGTPFLVLIGMFLRLAHLLFGQGNIIDDVIARPDFYIKVCSMFMLGLSTLVLIWGGKKILDKTRSITALFFIQGTYFLSEIVLSMQLRLIVDRLLPLVAFVFSVYTVLFIYNKISEKEFAIFSGLILGFGFIAKFSFVVLAFIPPLILNRRNWIRYSWYFLIAAFLSFLPVIDKFGNAKKFILQLILNKGTYGVGERGILDADMLYSTLAKLYNFGENFVWFFALALVSIIVFLLRTKGKKENRKKALFLVGFLIASILMAIMVSKNFKDYYLIPTLGVSGLVTFLALHFFSFYFKLNKLIQSLLAIAVFGFLFIPIVGDLNAFKEVTAQKRQARLETKSFIDENIGANNYWFLEPGWISGPFEANGLLWGISYVANKNDFTENYMNLNPKILTYEGDNKPIKHFRTKDADIEKIFREENFVYLFSTPGRHTKNLLAELSKQAHLVHMKINPDTIFINQQNKDIIIKASFSKIEGANDSLIHLNSFFNDLEGNFEFWKQNALTKEKSFSGATSSKIQLENKSSSVFEITSDSLLMGELSVITISSKYYQSNTKNSTRLVLEVENEKNDRFWYPVFCIDYFDTVGEWSDFNYKIFLPEKYKKVRQLKIYFYNSSKAPVYLDDLLVNVHFEL